MEIRNDEYKHMRQRAIEFVKKNRQLYGFIEFHCLIDVLKSMDAPDLYIIELAREVLDELGCIPAEYNIYERFSRFEKTFLYFFKINRKIHAENLSKINFDKFDLT